MSSFDKITFFFVRDAATNDHKAKAKAFVLDYLAETGLTLSRTIDSAIAEQLMTLILRGTVRNGSDLRNSAKALHSLARHMAVVEFI